MRSSASCASVATSDPRRSDIRSDERPGGDAGPHVLSAPLAVPGDRRIREWATRTSGRPAILGRGPVRVRIASARPVRNGCRAARLSSKAVADHPCVAPSPCCVPTEMRDSFDIYRSLTAISTIPAGPTVDVVTFAQQAGRNPTSRGRPWSNCSSIRHRPLYSRSRPVTEVRLIASFVVTGPGQGLIRFLLKTGGTT